MDIKLKAASIFTAGATILTLGYGFIGVTSQEVPIWKKNGTLVSIVSDNTTVGTTTFSGEINMDGGVEFDATKFSISSLPIYFRYPDMTDAESAKGGFMEWGGVMQAGDYYYGSTTNEYTNDPGNTFTIPTTRYNKWAWIGAHYDSPASTGEPIHQHLNLETVKADWETVITRLGISFGEDIAKMQVNMSDLTITNNGQNDNGKLFLQNDVFDTNSFQFFPYGIGEGGAGNRTNGLAITLATSTSATTTVLNALGDTRLFMNDDVILLTNKIGIGTSSPQVALEVNKSDSNTSVTTGNAPAIRIVNTDITANNMGELSFTTNDSTGAPLRSASVLGINVSHVTSAVSGALAFLTRHAGSFSEKMRILSNGNIGMGTSTPTTQLQITASSTNATTTVTIGKIGQNKGSCLELYDAAGSPIYAYVASGATTFTLSTVSCK